MFDISNSTIKAYQKKDGRISLSLNTYLCFDDYIQFNFHAYIDIECSLKYKGQEYSSNETSLPEHPFLSDKKFKAYKAKFYFILPLGVTVEDSCAELELRCYIKNISEKTEVIKKVSVIERIF